MRTSFIALFTGGLLALVVPTAHAESWVATDRRADVQASPYRPSADPCYQPPDRRQRNDRRHDITQLAVDHGPDVVVLSLSMRDVVRRDAQTTYDLHIRTPGNAYYVDVTRFEPGQDLHVELAEEPDYPSPAELGDNCSFGFLATVLPCEGLTVDPDAMADLVTVTVPRNCLGDPSWVKVAAEVYGFTKTDAHGRFTVFSDVWAQHGQHKTGFLPPFGPRVRTS